VSVAAGIVNAVPELRDHVEFIPKVGFAQGAVRDAAHHWTPSELRIAVKLRPTAALGPQCGK
jgi:hypothetical protein